MSFARKIRRLVTALALCSLLALCPTATLPTQALTHPPPKTQNYPENKSIWEWPVHPRPEITRFFELEYRYGPGHRGIDLAVTAEAPIYAPDDGKVHFVGVVVDRPLLSIQHPNGIRSTFEPVEAIVEAGQIVTRGQLIGHLAAAPTHLPVGGLHLGARLAKDYLDPLALLGEIPRAILLPVNP